LLIVDWMVTEDDSEKKLVYKKFDNGEIQFILVEKVINGSNRVTNKKKLTELEYKDLLSSTKVHLEKRRFEFNYIQSNISFALKYDEFKGGKLIMLEVDGANEVERTAFNAKDFPYKLAEVMGDMRYYGYRVVQMI
jgi:hypothetical protein